MELKPGYKQTEVGVIPKDWETCTLSKVLDLKSGHAFSSDFFTKNGVILLTPGNFKLDGGLYFNKRNTTRYSGSYNSSMCFDFEDLLIVMTDLTPDCNLLGKPAFFRLNETVLHNQRIGKVVLKNDLLTKAFLFWFFLSPLHAARMKQTATGSTVRHTSNSTIYSSTIPFPPTKAEQEAIAGALSDADELIASLEKLIEKKRMIKQGAMQELLTGKKRLPGFQQKPGYKQTEVAEIPEDWEVKILPEVCSFRGGKAHEQFISSSGSYICVNSKFISSNGTVRKFSTKNFCCAKKGDILMVMSDLPNGKALAKAFLVKKENLYAVNQRVCALSSYKDSEKFLYYFLNRNKYFLKYNDGVNQTHLLNNVFEKCPVILPSIKAEQDAIASVLSDMDADIEALEKKLEKARKIKAGMMHNLLTGTIRLV